LITAPQLRAARALLGVDQRELAHLAGLSVPTIQRMEASEELIRGTVDSLMKLVHALEAAGVQLIAEDAISAVGGRGVRLKKGFQKLKEAPKRKAGPKVSKASAATRLTKARTSR
jgi:transcriptional regulator with XRE-family HTH domain